MRFNILVTGAAYSSQSGYSAVRFCAAALHAGHVIDQVFFYQDGVTQACALSVPMSDEFDVLSSWVDFSERSGAELVVCVSAAERRGVLNVEQAVEFEKLNSSLHGAFKVEGLGSLHEASLAADRTVTFK